MSSSNQPALSLDLPISGLRGVGSERAAQLARLDIHTVGDLLLHRPRRYEDRRHFRQIAALDLKEPATTRGTIIAAGLKRWGGGAKSVFEFIMEDGSARLHCRWWNLPFMQDYFKVGDEVLVFGKLNSVKPRTIDHPETEVIEAGEEISVHLNRIVPIYPLTEGLPQRWLRSLIARAVDEFSPVIPESLIGSGLVGLPAQADAIRLLHSPTEMADAETARRRLALDEWIDLQVAIQTRRNRLESNARGLPCAGNNKFIRSFLAQLGFRLTEAQTKILREIRSDMGGAHPMRRLLQGDVGAGKTVVAACAALMAIESGYDVALMAPTEILAEQHYKNFTTWFSRLKINVELMTGSIKTSNHAPAHPNASSLHIGTHALIEKAFNPRKLGLVIIDEQHKFGVTQREKLLRKGVYPHLLVMTATPIPRTLGLTVYGDLDLSVIDQLPQGRAKIKTFVRSEETLPKVWKFIQEKLTQGRQAFVVCPRVEESDEKSGLKTVVKEFEKLQKIFAPARVGLLHGRMRSEEKESVMTAFRENQIRLLLATSVIEVGIDVPNATVMLIENADRFGLAQLHQLRGRIGRGAEESFCILIESANSGEKSDRLKILEETTDGFKIAEADLTLRGPGELVGREQSGLPSFRFADFRTDHDLIEQARKWVREKLK